MDLTTLYRPVGQREYDLIAASGFLRFPEQPIFYPVLNEEYAIQIARDWNTRDAANGNVGYVLRFAVRSVFLNSYHPVIVGTSRHTEYWIPAERLEEFNDSIVDRIETLHEFR